ncbi:MAG: GNAT family N-acetyltransferase [Oscillibacter sp.]|nr:GNAT family N-acetyltransferase [Oscillibacter sp.]
MTVRRFRAGDENELSALIRRCFLEVNIRDYSEESLRYWAELYTPAHVRSLAETGHTYVAEEDGTLLGTGTILRRSETDAAIEGLYVLPERLREGIASRLMAACESDPVFADAKRVWVDSSITARPFYEALGYLHETGEPVCIDHDHYLMYRER